MLKQSIVLCLWFDDTQKFLRYLCPYTFYVLDSYNSVGIQGLQYNSACVVM